MVAREAKKMSNLCRIYHSSYVHQGHLAINCFLEDVSHICEQSKSITSILQGTSCVMYDKIHAFQACRLCNVIIIMSTIGEVYIPCDSILSWRNAILAYLALIFLKTQKMWFSLKAFPEVTLSTLHKAQSPYMDWVHQLHAWTALH